MLIASSIGNLLTKSTVLIAAVCSSGRVTAMPMPLSESFPSSLDVACSQLEYSTCRCMKTSLCRATEALAAAPELLGMTGGSVPIPGRGRCDVCVGRGGIEDGSWVRLRP